VQEADGVVRSDRLFEVAHRPARLPTVGSDHDGRQRTVLAAAGEVGQVVVFDDFESFDERAGEGGDLARVAVIDLESAALARRKGDADLSPREDVRVNVLRGVPHEGADELVCKVPDDGADLVGGEVLGLVDDDDVVRLPDAPDRERGAEVGPVGDAALALPCLVRSDDLIEQLLAAGA